MQTDTAAEYLLRRIRMQSKTYVEKVAEGVGSWDEYRRMLGVIQALRWVEALVVETAKKAANDEPLEDDWGFDE